MDNMDQMACEAEQDCVWDNRQMTCLPADLADACGELDTQDDCEMVDLCEWDTDNDECIEAAGNG